MSARITRAEMRRRLGEPSDQIGSANEPRAGCDGGRRWNEKWIYRARGGSRDGRIERVVLWHRGDLVGVFRIGDDGELGEDSRFPVGSTQAGGDGG